MFGIRILLKNNSALSNLSCQCSLSKFVSQNPYLIDYLPSVFKHNYSETKIESLQSDRNILLAEQPKNKILKIGIIGTPNVGKSTFINQIVGRRVFAVSNKVHTTRVRARAVINIDNTQVVFLDTPGLVSQVESTKHHLEKSFLNDGEIAMTEANVVAVIHDVSNALTRGMLDPKVLRLLYLYPWKHSVLILNKVDTVKKKRYLLELADRLTCKTLVDPETNKSKYVEHSRLTEDDIRKEIKTKSGWPNFSQVFMVSALEGLGVGDVMEYLMQYAKPGQWMYPDSTFTDQAPEKIIVDTVKAKLLDKLPEEIPYNTDVQMELYHELEDGTISAVVLITCPHMRGERMILKQIRRIAQDVEAELRNTFLTQVLVRLAVQTAG